MDQFALGVDMGGSKISYALVDQDGKVFLRALEQTRAAEGPAAVINRMAAKINEFLSLNLSNVIGIGIGAAGMTDSQRGIVINASNLHWRNVPLKQDLLNQLNPGWENKTWVDKDTNAAALGEMFFGSGQGSKDLLYVTVGTGIGGGMILGGQLYHGVSEGASDIGHLVLVEDGPLCGCGKRGCLETLASGPAIARLAVKLLGDSANSPLKSLPTDQITAQTVVEAARAGDSLALQCLETAGKWLGIALAYYIDINNPDRIIIGGGVGLAGELLSGPARRIAQERSLPTNAQAVQILQAGLVADSGVIGAACLVWQNISKG